jgi:phosphatidylinositol alpha-mannosyltransferase
MAAKIIKAAPSGAAIVGTFHIFPSGPMSTAGSRLLRLALAGSIRRFDRIVSVSPAAARFAESVYHLQTEVIPNAIDLNKFKITAPPRKPGKSVVFLGRLVGRKGAKYLIEAFARLDAGDTRLIIAGDGPQRRDLESLASKLGVKDRVEFTGYIKEADKPALLAGADIACFPSLYGESFGIVLIEAMAAGSKTVLAGDNPGYRSVLGGLPELLVDPTQTDQFVQRLETFLSDENLTDWISRWQSETVKQYDIDIVGKKLVALYNGQIARPAKKSNNKAHG